jgi:hypothetical protein
MGFQGATAMIDDGDCPRRTSGSGAVMTTTVNSPDPEPEVPPPHRPLHPHEPPTPILPDPVEPEPLVPEPQPTGPDPA